MPPPRSWSSPSRRLATGIALFALALVAFATHSRRAPTSRAPSPIASDRAATLRRTFGAHASEPFAEPLRIEAASRVATTPIASAAPESTLRLTLPARGEDELVFDLGGDTQFHVRELGTLGASETIDGALSYAHRDGRVYWSSGEGGHGYEEWLDLRAGIAFAGREVASWRVRDARLSQLDDAVIVRDAHGRPRMRVTAPRAYDASGREVRATLRVVDDRIALFVDANGARVLVDPWWEQFGVEQVGAGSAVVLADGDVLLITQNQVAYRFDEAASSIEVVTSMPWFRRDFGSQRVPSGDVLVFGGDDGLGPTAETYLYHPATDAWSTPTAMNTARTELASVSLADGDVLAVGGVMLGGSGTTVVERWSEATRTWSVVAPLSAARERHALARLADGRVLAIGGSKTVHVAATSEIYDPIANTWTPTSSVPNDCNSPLAIRPSAMEAVLVLCADASADADAALSAWLYDPSDDSWSPRAEPITATGFVGFSATEVEDGRIVVVGDPLARVAAYDPVGDEWSFATTLAGPRIEHSAVLLPDGRALFAGGVYSDQSTAVLGLEIFDGASDTVSSGGLPVAGRTAFTWTKLGDGRVLVAGGHRTTTPSYSLPAFEFVRAEVFDPTTRRWSTTEDMHRERSLHTATLLADGRVVVIGGWSRLGGVLETEIFDPVTNAWSLAASIPEAVMRHAATLLLDGRILVTGSNTSSTTTGLGGTNAWLFDPTANTWTAAAPTLLPRYASGAVRLADGRVLALGTDDRDLGLSGEIYDPATNSWTAIARSQARRWRVMSVLLDDGRVALGGSHSSSQDPPVLELFDPSTGAWRSVPLNTMQLDPVELELQPSGELLLIYGGYGWLRVFDPVSDTISIATAESAPFSASRAQGLANGEILILGDMTDYVGGRWLILHSGCAHENGGCDPLTTCVDSSRAVVCGACPEGTQSTTGRGDAPCVALEDAGVVDSGTSVPSAPGCVCAVVGRPMRARPPFGLVAFACVALLRWRRRRRSPRPA